MFSSTVTLKTPSRVNCTRYAPDILYSGAVIFTAHGINSPLLDVHCQFLSRTYLDQRWFEGLYLHFTNTHELV